ncbi:MAG: class I SAM-dependent methyltransferase [Gammaproteobacteria bacterium]|nr:class I SAM-dependent methyltransferase [Gammaproteobacteria bacterium]
MHNSLPASPVSRQPEVAAAEKLRRAIRAWRGELAVQLGGGGAAWCDAVQYGSFVCIGSGPDFHSVAARDAALPLPEASAELVLLIHRLGGSDDAQSVIAEAARVLRAEGRLVVVERRFSVAAAGWIEAFRGRTLGRLRLRRMIGAAGLEWRAGRDFAGSRPHARACLNLGAGAYGASAVKRVPCPRLLRPSWKAPRSGRQTVLREHGHAG